MKIDGIRCLIFDMGGTLYRPALDLCSLTKEFLSRVKETGKKTYRDAMILEALVEPAAWLDSHMVKNNVGPHWEPSQEQWLEFDRRLLKALGVRAGIDEAAVRYQAIWDTFLRETTPDIIEGVFDSLQELSERGMHLGIASNRFGDPSEILAHDGLLDIVDSVEYSNVPGYRKPSPYMLLNVADELGVNPRHCAYVGNIVKYDVLAATDAEMVPFLLTWCDPQEEEKTTEDTLVVGHIAQLLEVL